MSTASPRPPGSGRPVSAVLLAFCAAVVACGGGGRPSPAAPSPVATPVSNAQRDYLVALYNGTNGAAWSNKTNWTTATPYTADTDPCGDKPWFGVTCAGGAVVAISLSANGLVGELPEFTGMASLETFDVGPRAPANTNRLSGRIPNLSGLTSLRVFRARSQQLTGPIPSLSGLTALREFDVGNNQLSGPLPSLAGLTALQRFIADNNQFSGAIPSLSGLTSLQVFTLGFTLQTPAPRAMTGPIPSLAGLSSLVEFDVQSLGLTGPLPDLGGAQALRVFRANVNALSGPLPDLSSLPALQTFWVHSNALTGAVPSLGGSLADLRLEGNLLSGPMPAPPAAMRTAFLCRNALRSTGDPAADAAWENVAAQGTGKPTAQGGQPGWLACQCAVSGRFC